MAAVPRLFGHCRHVLVDQSVGSQGHPDFGDTRMYVTTEGLSSSS